MLCPPMDIVGDAAKVVEAVVFSDRLRYSSTQVGWRCLMDVSTLVSSVFDHQLPFRVEAYDGSSADPTVKSPANVVTLKILRR
jgi:hypothetical protein